MIRKNRDGVSIEMIMDLCDGLSSLQSPKEAAKVLRDLLTYKELTMLAKRIKIAELLKRGLGYRDISEMLGAGQDTVARVQEWMEIAGEGYDFLLDQIQEARKVRPSLPQSNYPEGEYPKGALRRFMERFPLMFWPELALIELSKIPAKKRDKETKELISQLKQKAELYKEIEQEKRRNL